MIEQVLYRREGEAGYKEYSSAGLSKEEANTVNNVMHKIAEGIKDLKSNADAPFLLYPFNKMRKFCLAIFQEAYQGGRRSAVNHGLLIDENEYKELVKTPERVFGFTNRNFMSKNPNSRNELPTLKALDISENLELNKDFIFKEYNLKNSGYLQFLNAVYMSLSKNKGFKFGIRIDSLKDANKVMRHFGYLIMSMLPYELRDKASFCSRSVSESIEVTVQLLTKEDIKKIDIIYDINTGECQVNKSKLEIIDFYLSDLFDMSDSQLKDYFAGVNVFKDKLKLSGSGEAQYAVSKLLKLSQNPSLFASETAKDQITFIKDVLSLETVNTDAVNSIVVRLLPFVDSKHYMEAFNLDFELYRRLNLEKESDMKLISQIEDNIIRNYKIARIEEREQLFKSVLQSEQAHERTRKILEKFVEINEINLDYLLVDEYIKLYEEFFDTEWKSGLYAKIEAVFKRSDIAGKKRIWNRIYNSTKPGAKIFFIYKILHDEDEKFQKAVFDEMVDLYAETKNPQLKERLYKCISNVIRKEDDNYRLQILSKYNNSDELESSLWIDTYNAIIDYKSAFSDQEFLNCLKDKYDKSKNQGIRDLYLDYIGYAPVSELENIISQYSKHTKIDEYDENLINKVIYSLINDRKKISIEALKTLIFLIKDNSENELALYISDLYLADSSGDSNEIYEFLEKEDRDLYNNPHLNKEYLLSYDSYCASKLDERVFNDDNLLTIIKDFEKMQYNKESFSKINLLYQKYIEQQFEKCKTDYERFEKYKELINKIDSISSTQFGSQYTADLKNYAKDIFWEKSSIDTFDYEHCDIYRLNSEVYSLKFENHENHILADNISGLITDSPINGTKVDWDKVYSVFFSKRYIDKDDVRNHISKGFIKQYLDYGMSYSDPDYIAFDSVDISNLKMDYSKLLDNLHKYNYPIDDENIRSMPIFNYIPISTRLKKKVMDYNKYQSDNPQYNALLSVLSTEHFIFAILLLANNIFGAFVTNIFENIQTKNLLLFYNYAGYMLLVAVVAVLSIFMMLRVNLRRSTIYDTCIFGILIFNMLFSTIAVLASIKIDNAIVHCLIPVIFTVIMIFLNIKLDSIVREKGKEEVKLGDDIYG